MQQMSLIAPKPKRMYSVKSLTTAVSSQSQEVLGEMWWVTQHCGAKTLKTDGTIIAVQRLDGQYWLEQDAFLGLPTSVLTYSNCNRMCFSC